MLCLPRNEPALFKPQSGGPFNLPLPDSVSVAHLVLWTVITCTPQRNWDYGVAVQVGCEERAASNKQVLRDNSHVEKKREK